MKEIVLSVNGMKCMGCSNRIQNTISNIVGVLSIVANHEEGVVTVKTTDEIEESMIVDEIQNIGFEVIGREV